MGIFGKPPETKPTDPARGTATPMAVAAPPPAPCAIGAKTLIKGEVTGDEDILVEGTVEGQVRITGDLRVGPGGTVKATVSAQSVIVSGELIGDCSATNRVEIQATGRLTGNIRAPKIVIAEGAMFKGSSDMTARKEDPKPKEKAAAS